MEKRKITILIFLLVSLVLFSNFVAARNFKEAALRLNRIELRDGDVNFDGKVNVMDLATIGLNFGKTTENTNWDWKADIANTVGEIDVFDLAEVGLNFNKAYTAVSEDPVFVSPLSKDVQIGDEFSLDINISTTGQVFGVDFILNFDPSIIEVINLTEGNFLKQGASTSMQLCEQGTVLEICPVIDNVLGKIEFASVRLGTAQSVTGNGLLTRINFKAKNAGTSEINIVEFIAIDNNLNEIPGIPAVNGEVNVQPTGQNPPVLSGLPDKNVDEDVTPPANWIDLFDYASDVEDTDEQLTFSIQSQSNSALINCSIAGDRYLNCNKPSLNQNGYSDVVVKVTDTATATDTDTTRITVNPINDLPEAVDDSAVATEDTLVKIDVLANDKDVEGPVILDSITSPPGHGSAVINAGKVDYTPSLGYNGPDSFEYRIKDSDGATDTAKVNITVKEENDAPIINSFSPLTNPTINEKETQDFSITASDPDIGDVLTIKWYLNGVQVATGNSYTYTSTNCASQGIHEIKAVVSDGQATAEKIWQLTVLDTCTKVQLKAGNNIFSLPRNQQKTFNQLDTDCEVVIGGSRADLAYYQPNPTDLINNSNYVFVGLNDILYPGQGYFVKVENACYIEMSGNTIAIGDLGYLGTKQLKQGWNLIGSTTSVRGFSAGTCSLFDGVGILKYGYNVASCNNVVGYNGKYEYCTTEGGINRCRCSVDNFETGLGYWIRTANACSLA